MYDACRMCEYVLCKKWLLFKIEVIGCGSGTPHQKYYGRQMNELESLKDVGR